MHSEQDLYSVQPIPSFCVTYQEIGGTYYISTVIGL